MTKIMKESITPLLIILLGAISYGCQEDDHNANPTVEDYDGNVYKTVQIGDQVWMAENLRTTHYADGTAIPIIEDEAAWTALGINDKAMCYYDHSTANKDTYGALYTWAAAINGDASSTDDPSGVQGVCPDGWHLPSDTEWKELEMYLGMSREEADRPGFRGTNEGSKLAGNSGLWANEALENNAAFGTSGFEALPAGYRFYEGTFSHLGIYTNFWSATESRDSLAWSHDLFCYNVEVYRFTQKKDCGFSVRCVKDR